MHTGYTVWLCLDLLSQHPLGDALVAAAAVNVLDLLSFDKHDFKLNILGPWKNKHS